MARTHPLQTLVTAALLTALGLPAGAADGDRAAAVLKEAGVPGGLVVHLGCGDGRLTAALRAGDGYLVHGLDTDAANVAAARKHIRSLGLYGPVTADRLHGDRLPYIDNLVNLLVAEDLGAVPMAEVMRVLAPRGVAMVGGTKTVKPWPEDIDEWTHYLHGPDNNAVARDTRVGPPRHVQWLAAPRWTRNHHGLNSISSVVTARGRLFYIVDEATSANMNVPGKWALVARDAFSGVTLWKRPMATWAWHRTRFRSGPAQVTRLLVASGNRVYAPLGLNAPVSALDAATGKVLGTYAPTGGAEEIVLAGDALLVVKGTPVAEQAAQHAAFKDRYRFPSSKAVVAVGAEDGRKRWEWSRAGAALMPETLASDGKRVYFQDGESVACLDLASGKPLWTFGERGKKGRGKRVTYGRHVLVVADGVVLCKLAANLTAISADDGKALWECEGGLGFHAPEDLFVIGGLVWQGRHPQDSVAPPPIRDFNEARDLHTGQVKRTNHVIVDLQTAGHHHRCYRNKATVRYILTGKRGVEMMDLAGDNHSRNNWVRGTCQYGIMPANGLLYAPPHSCGCYPESLLKGFWALAAESPAVTQRAAGHPGGPRLTKGPAYGKPSPGEAAEEAWPQYRHDPLRSGVAGTVLPKDLTPRWRADLGGRLTQPVVAGGTVLVAAVDANTVYALDEKTGRVLWQRVVGGRVDSPPAVHGGTVLFGSADGSIYCLRLSDGQRVWRFLAAPADLRTVAFDRVESVWPAHGSVLVLNGVAYCTAGRSTWLDGGIALYGLDPATGAVVHQARFRSKHPTLGEGKAKAKKEYHTTVAQNVSDYRTFLASDRSDSFSMAAGAVTNVLVSDGRNVFLHHTTFDGSLKKQDVWRRHLFSTSGLLDGAENHRSHWVLGTGDFSRVPVAYSWIVNRPGRRGPTIAVPTGVMMVYNDTALWAAQRVGGASGKYQLLKRANAPFSEGETLLPDFRKVPKDGIAKPLWRNALPVRPRAMLKAGANLYLGCMPVAVPPDDPHAAYEGRRGGMIRVVSADDGSTVAEYGLESPVVWDGMAAADGGLFVSLRSGTVACWR